MVGGTTFIAPVVTATVEAAQTVRDPASLEDVVAEVTNLPFMARVSFKVEVTAVSLVQFAGWLLVGVAIAASHCHHA